jgi:hypothetical protein
VIWTKEKLKLEGRTMARKDSKKHGKQSKHQAVPPGATRKAFDRPESAGEGPPRRGRGDRYAAGTPGGGTEVGGLAGTNIGDGDPDNADLEEVFGSGVEEPEEQDEGENGPPYSGPSGGAVGGSPAEGRSSGGNVHRGIAPGGVHRGDSTIGADPDMPGEGR